MKYLVDTDWVIDGIADMPGVRHALDSFGRDGVAVSIVTLGELFEGAYAFPNLEDRIRTHRRFLFGYTVLNLSDPIIEESARHRALLRKQGQAIPDLDLLVAATALVHDLTLLTRHLRDFRHAPDLRLFGQPPGSRAGDDPAV